MHCDISHAIIVATSLGKVGVRLCVKGLHEIRFLGGDTVESAGGAGSEIHIVDGDASEWGRFEPHVSACLAWLRAFFKGSSRKGGVAVPVCPHVLKLDGVGMTMKEQVLRCLALHVPFGATVSYSELSALAGLKPTAARFVGTCLATNPVPLVIPCHRVVRKDGKAGEFCRGGQNHLKRWLLDFEAAHSVQI